MVNLWLIFGEQLLQKPDSSYTKTVSEQVNPQVVQMSALLKAAVKALGA